MSKQHKHLRPPKNLPNQSQIPVCIEDLPSYCYISHPEMTLEEVTRELEQSPELPGILVMTGKELTGVLPRQKIFERLGHMYGVELFLRKPVVKLEQSLQSKPFSLPGYTRIEDAVSQALARPQNMIYDPIVVVHEDGSIGLLDMYVLFLAQSNILTNLSNTVGKLESLEKIMKSSSHSLDIKFQKALDLLAQVVPYHQAAIYRKEKKKLELVFGRGLSLSEAGSKEHYLEKNVFIHDLLKRTHEPISIPDVRSVSVWQDLPGLANPRSWLGVPILYKDEVIGLLSLARVSFSPFSKGETDISLAFAHQLDVFLR